jgi:hypothetical protein
MISIAWHYQFRNIVFASFLELRLSALDIGIIIGTNVGLLNIKATAQIASEEKFAHISHVSLSISEISNPMDSIVVDY